jgi:N-acetylglucosamine kinase-like BadF-type ATPase
MTVLAGVDAGGSHTEAAVSRDGGPPMGRTHGGPGNIGGSDPDAAIGAILDTLNHAMRAAEVTEADALVIGCAGAGSVEARGELERAVVAREMATRVRIVTDAEIALESAFGSSPGILLSAGTGSIAYARDAAGQVLRTGGHGWRFGDEGSAYAIGRDAIGAALRAGDGRGATTTLTGRISAAIQRTHGEPLALWVRVATTHDVARLAWVVADAASDHDAVAEQILEEAARDLAQHVAALCHHFPGDVPVDVALNGGLLHPDSPFRLRVEAAIGRVAGQVRVRPGTVDPVDGALRLAGDLLHSS